MRPVFTARVPMPVISVTPAHISADELLASGTAVITFTLSNFGLVAGMRIAFSLPQSPQVHPSPMSAAPACS